MATDSTTRDAENPDMSLTGPHAVLARSGTTDKSVWLRARQVELLNRHTPTSLVSSALVSVALVMALWSSVSVAVLGAWLLAGLVVTALRVYSRQRFRKTGDATAPEQERACLAGILASGIYWALPAVILFPAGQPALQAVLAMCVAGMCAAAVSVLAAQRRAFLLFAAPALGALTLRFALEGTQLSLLMAALSAGFLAGVVHTAGINARMIQRLLCLSHDNEAMTRRLRHQATRDPLVNLLNRREFSRQLRHAGARALSDARCYALVFIDLDNFKQVNDTHGHAAGDAVLRQVAQRLVLQTRDDDVIARIGGDEFVILLDDCIRERAAEIGQRLLDAMTLRRYRWGDTRIAVTASIGIAYAVPGEDRTDLVLQAADAACYAAKEAGRNCLRIRTAGPVLVTSGRFTINELANSG